MRFTHGYSNLTLSESYWWIELWDDQVSFSHHDLQTIKADQSGISIRFSKNSIAKITKNFKKLPSQAAS
jgi:hypothetical protein